MALPSARKINIPNSKKKKKISAGLPPRLTGGPGLQAEGVCVCGGERPPASQPPPPRLPGPCGLGLCAEPGRAGPGLSGRSLPVTRAQPPAEAPSAGGGGGGGRAAPPAALQVGGGGRPASAAAMGAEQSAEAESRSGEPSASGRWPGREGERSGTLAGRGPPPPGAGFPLPLGRRGCPREGSGVVWRRGAEAVAVEKRTAFFFFILPDCSRRRRPGPSAGGRGPLRAGGGSPEAGRGPVSRWREQGEGE